jgi:serine/threonine-protein kinase
VQTTEQLNIALTGRYAIERLIGEGGMATVYLARDVRHNRKVALKVLKPDLGAIVGVERFLSEIEVTANLQHPNLLPLFDSGAADGLLFYVMPYVEGESLRARIEREKQLPVEESVRIAAAVASALDYAHRRGVIHRDLKPENILLHDGQPLVADFGIALAVSNAGGDRVTQTGLSLGTPRYMSPEQATGDRAIDARTDIYSLGAVTYEMLTGDPPHTGSSSQAIIARVLTERPRSIRSSRPNVPPHVEATVDRALEKLAADRFESAKEFADALTGKVAIATSTSLTAAVPAAQQKRTALERALMAALGAVAGAAVMTGIFLARGPAELPAAPEARFDFETPLSPGPLQISMSPDGRTVLFGAFVTANQVAIWARPLDAPEARPIAATIGVAGYTFWSPDSRHFAFTQDGKLRRLALDGGSAETICDASGVVRGGSWNADDVIVFSMDGALYRVAASGALPTKLSVPATDSLWWEWPWFLPDGEHFLVLLRGGEGEPPGLYVASLGGGAPVRVMSATTRATFAAPDQVLFVRDEALYAQTIDMRRFQPVGDPVRVIDDVGTNLSNGSAGVGVSANGALVKRAHELNRLEFQLHWYSRAGAKLGPVGQQAPVREMALSPDGKRMAFTRPASNTSISISDVWIIDLSSNITSRLVSRSEGVSGVLWTPDSRAVTYLATTAGSDRDSILSRQVGGSVDSLVHVARGGTTRAEAYRGDGKSVLLRQGARLMSLDLVGGGQPKELARFTAAVDELRLSPDSRFVSYNINESGMWQVWVASYPSFENRRQVSANGGVQARWRADGKELLFLSLDGKVMVATLVAGTTPEFKAPTELFQSPMITPSGTATRYDVTGDGQRFLFPVQTDSSLQQVPSLTVVLNWTNALKKN